MGRSDMHGLPRIPDELSVEWLTEVLRANNTLTDSRVTAFDVTQIGVFSNVIWRISLEYDRTEPHAPLVLVAKQGKPAARIPTGTGFQTEIKFYREIAPQLQLRVPQAYFGHCDEITGTALLLLEYVAGSVPVKFTEGINETHAICVIDALAKMHAQWWQQVDELPALPRLADPLFRASIASAFDRGWHRSRDYFEATHGPEFLAIGDALVGHVADSIAGLGEPATLLHGDAHFENLPLLEGDGEQDVFFHDWAATHYGHAAFDVAVFSVQSYATDSRRRWEKQVVAMHADAVRAKGIDWQDPWGDYRRGVLYWMIRMLEDAELRPGAEPWIVIDRYVAAAVDLEVGELIV